MGQGNPNLEFVFEYQGTSLVLSQFYRDCMIFFPSLNWQFKNRELISLDSAFKVNYSITPGHDTSLEKS